MKPLIYTTPDCPYCHDIKDFLNDLRVPYEEIDATEMDEIEIVPELHLGDTVLVGFEPKHILKLLKKYDLIKD